MKFSSSHSLPHLCSEKTLKLHYWEIVCSYRYLGWQIYIFFLPEFSSATSYLLTCVVSDEKAAAIFLFSFLWWVFLSPSGCFWNFLLVFFSSLSMSSVLCFLCPALGYLCLLNLSFDVVHYFWKMFDHYLFKYSSCFVLSILLLGLQLQVLDDLILSHSSSMLCSIIFHSLFFFVFTFGWFLLTYLQVHWFSPQPAQVYWAYPRNSCKDLYSCPGLTRVIFSP